MSDFNKVVTASSTQTVLDLTLELNGNLDSVFDLLAANPSIENVNSDPTGEQIAYQINNTAVQKFYTAKGIKVSTKPSRYRNTNESALITDLGAYLVQGNGYKILI